MVQRKPKQLAEYLDACGDKRTIHKLPNGEIRVAREHKPVSDLLGASAAVHVGKRIREERLKQGLTMKALMTRAGLSYGSKMRCHQIETARDGVVKLGTLYALALALGIDVTVLLPNSAEVLQNAGVSINIAPVLGRATSL